MSAGISHPVGRTGRVSRAQYLLAWSATSDSTAMIAKIIQARFMSPARRAGPVAAGAAGVSAMASFLQEVLAGGGAAGEGDGAARADVARVGRQSGHVLPAEVTPWARVGHDLDRRGASGEHDL